MKQNLFHWGEAVGPGQLRRVTFRHRRLIFDSQKIKVFSQLRGSEADPCGTGNASGNRMSSGVASKPLLVPNASHRRFLFYIFSEALNNFLKKPHVHEQCRNLTLPGTGHANSWQLISKHSRAKFYRFCWQYQRGGKISY